jgi:hypothetical protein
VAEPKVIRKGLTMNEKRLIDYAKLEEYRGTLNQYVDTIWNSLEPASEFILKHSRPDIEKPKTDTESPVEWCRVFASYHDLPNDRKLKGLLCLKTWVKEETGKQKTNTEKPKKLKQVYVCKDCYDYPCKVKLNGEEDTPTFCLLDGNKAKWIKVVK